MVLLFLAVTAARAETVLSCDELALQAVPRDRAARAEHLRLLEQARQRCLAHPAFLAALGGALLDDGDLDQALLWLERALLLDPTLLGARADLALALAAGGDRRALVDLVQEWGSRTDVPLGLVERLAQAMAADRLPAQSRWTVLRELTLLAGYENNLNQSPRLAELTITPPGGPIDLPLLEALEPRPGGALMADAKFQAGYRADDRQWWLAGISAVGRLAPSVGETDWHVVQVAGSHLFEARPWRFRLAASELWYGGQLAEPYRLDRLSLSVERDLGHCLGRSQVDGERRHQRRTPVGDGRLLGIQLSAQCALDAPRRWLGTVTGRYGIDRPTDDGRAGGDQSRWGIGLRLQGQMAEQRRLDAALRYGDIRDALGYSPLLLNNARRRQRPLQFGVEIAQPLALVLGAGGPNLVLQLQGLRQRSNLELFDYRALAIYGGVRWQW